jgi:hypothetical protein
MEKSRALKKLKESLPASPSKMCAVISTYLSRRAPESPTVLNLRKSISPVDSVILFRKTSELQGRTRACAVFSSEIFHS